MLMRSQSARIPRPALVCTLSSSSLYNDIFDAEESEEEGGLVITVTVLFSIIWSNILDSEEYGHFESPSFRRLQQRRRGILSLSF